MTEQKTKTHYIVLDALRGVAALCVVLYHIFEGFAFAGGEPVIRGMNHGYLAVDFFFLLSGFVISYAYDDRWAGGFTLGQFFKRRLRRLHPMVIVGATLGAICFVVGGSVQWDGTHVAISAVMWALLLAMFMIPAYPGSPLEVRGNGEMFPLNGPTWSLFFEYLGNIIYALCIRRLSTKALRVLVWVLGVMYFGFVVFDATGLGFIGVGWTLDWMNFAGGLLRMMFPFSFGMLISRTFRRMESRHGFAICSICLAAVFFMPYMEASLEFGGGVHATLNGLFEFLCVALVFPLIVRLGASTSTGNMKTLRAYDMLGRLSFPLYLVHYPFMYLFYQWMIRTQQHTLSQTWPQALAVYFVSVVTALVCIYLFEPKKKSSKTS